MRYCSCKHDFENQSKWNKHVFNNKLMSLTFPLSSNKYHPHETRVFIRVNLHLSEQLKYLPCNPSANVPNTSLNNSIPDHSTFSEKLEVPSLDYGKYSKAEMKTYYVMRHQDQLN